MAIDIVKTREPGDTVTFETTVKKKDPFDSSKTKIDPDTLEITITDPDDNKIVNAVSMTRQNNGEYYYHWNSSTSDPTGDYLVEIEASEGTNGEIWNGYVRLET